MLADKSSRIGVAIGEFWLPSFGGEIELAGMPSQETSSLMHVSQGKVPEQRTLRLHQVSKLLAPTSQSQQSNLADNSSWESFLAR